MRISTCLKVAALVGIVVLVLTPSYASNQASARLTIEVIVMPTVQTRMPWLMNSGTVPHGTGQVAFDLTPPKPLPMDFQVNSRPMESGDVDEGRRDAQPESENGNQEILQTLTVTAR
jgi:hypothetical protein